MTTAKEISALTPVERLAYWINERESIRKKHDTHKKWPWTDDPILQMYRFTNTHREDDKVTKWIKYNWRDRHPFNKNLWHAMIVARYINWPETLRAMLYPEPWPDCRARVKRALLHREEDGYKVFTGAYIVSTNGAPIGKIAYVLDLFDLAWRHRLGKYETLQETHTALMTIKGIGSFMAAQIVADLKHTPYLRAAPDWWTWAAPGPGSMRGLSKVRGVSTAYRWKSQEFIQQLMDLRAEIASQISDVPALCLQDLQNCLCEYDKYERVRLGKGRPRAKYRPTSPQLNLWK